MLVQKNTVIPKKGQQDKLIELIKRAETYVPFKVPYRILIPTIGPFDVIVFEQEFKDMAEQDSFWQGFTAKVPESFWVEWNDATEAGGSNEIWRTAA